VVVRELHRCHDATLRRLDSLTSDATHLAAFEGRDWVQLIFAGAVWGASFVFIAAGLDHFSPGVVTVGRLALGCLALGLLRSARTVRIDRADWPRVVLVGVTWLAFPMTLFPIAQQHISSGLAGMLNGSVPVFAAIITSFGLRRLPGRSQLIGLGVGALGIVLLGLPAMSDGGSSALGVVLVVLACLSYGVAVTINVPLAQKYGSIPTFWRAQMVGLVLTLPYGAWGLTHGSEWNAKSAGAVVVLGVFGTALAFVAMVGLSARVGATRASSLTYFEAIIALALGALVRGEQVVALELTGCGVLLLGAWFISRDDRPLVVPDDDADEAAATLVVT
jgi:drug/metabolite transporter (DMT)-like permease